jgi:ATP-dependent DNA helicase RecQ
MILSCVKRAEDKLGYNVGASTIADTLHGSKGKRILELGLDKISTYGLMREKKKTTITELIEYLKSEGYVQKDPMYGGLFLTKKSREVLFENKKVKMKVKSATKDNNKTEKPIPAKIAYNEDEDLLNALKALRMNIARKSKVPAYIICSNATLTDMASKKPQNITQLLTVSGIGEAKAEKYGSMFINVIKEYM